VRKVWRGRKLLERRRLDMRYYSMSRDEENHRQVDPYHLTVFDGGFYLVGYCHLRRPIASSRSSAFGS
jgi:predicted DNA-binding transcriptional regulator YafY